MKHGVERLAQHADLVGADVGHADVAGAAVDRLAGRHHPVEPAGETVGHRESEDGADGDGQQSEFDAVPGHPRQRGDGFAAIEADPRPADEALLGQDRRRHIHLHRGGEQGEGQMPAAQQRPAHRIAQIFADAAGLGVAQHPALGRQHHGVAEAVDVVQRLHHLLQAGVIPRQHPRGAGGGESAGETGGLLLADAHQLVALAHHQIADEHRHHHRMDQGHAERHLIPDRKGIFGRGFHFSGTCPMVSRYCLRKSRTG